MTIKEILIEAKKLLLTKGWTTGVLARDEEGNEVEDDDPRATCYCLMGACYAAISDAPLDVSSIVHEKQRVGRILHDKAHALGYKGIGHFNDGSYGSFKERTFEEVISFLDELIEEQIDTSAKTETGESHENHD